MACQSVLSEKRQTESKLENDSSYFGKMQQVWRIDGSAQSMQKLWELQQERDYCQR